MTDRSEPDLRLRGPGTRVVLWSEPDFRLRGPGTRAVLWMAPPSAAVMAESLPGMTPQTDAARAEFALMYRAHAPREYEEYRDTAHAHDDETLDAVSEIERYGLPPRSQCDRDAWRRML